jgi:hypothetical protein
MSKNGTFMGKIFQFMSKKDSFMGKDFSFMRKPLEL